MVHTIHRMVLHFPETPRSKFEHFWRRWDRTFSCHKIGFGWTTWWTTSAGTVRRRRFKKSSFPRNIERVKNVLKCIEAPWKARKIDCHRMLRTLCTTFCTTRCHTVLFSIHFHQKMVWAPSKMVSGKCQKMSKTVTKKTPKC